jgi:plastocyanin
MKLPGGSSRLLLISTFVIAALALASCGGDDDNGGEPTGGSGGATTEAESNKPAPSGNAPAPSGDAVRSARVEIVEFTYDPDPVTIEEGGKVTWINRDSAPHTATADDDSFDTETLEQGKLKSESFKEAGKYPYFCEIHPDMRGTVEVVASG